MDDRKEIIRKAHEALKILPSVFQVAGRHEELALRCHTDSELRKEQWKEC